MTLGNMRASATNCSKLIRATLATALMLVAARAAVAGEVCNETIQVTDKEQPISNFIGSIVELYEEEGGGDPKKYRHVYLFLPETICFVSNDEDRAAALNMIQLNPTNKIPNALSKASVVTVAGKVIAVHVGHGFGTPYAIEVIKVTK